MIKNIFYFNHINIIGGVENFFYELAKKYNAWDIVIYYKSGDKEQIERLKKFVEVKKYKNEIIECEKAFFNYNASIIDNVIAKEYYMIIHADYKAQGVKPPMISKITKYIGVSQAVCDSFTELTGKPCELCYNPISIDPPKRVLKLVSATRLTKEKGRQRMIKFAEILDRANIPYIWEVYTNSTEKIDNPHVIYRNPTLEINGILKNADYVIQLSDSESYCYTMIQALLLGTPIIVCPWECLKELGITEEYGFILPFDLSNVPIQEIYTKEFNFKYCQKNDRWNEILAKGESQYQKDLNTRCLVEATDEYINHNIKDKELGIKPQKGFRWNTNLYRAKYLNRDNENKWQMIKIIEIYDKELDDKNEKSI